MAIKTAIKTEPITVTLASPPRSYQIQIGHGTLSQIGLVARQCLHPLADRLVVVSNARIADLYAATVLKQLKASGFRASLWLMGDGERFKTLGAAEKALQFLRSAGVERTDAVVALGGGVVGDLAGFAAATYLRGIDVIQVPTTIIGQIDAAIGGKTGVNLPQGKNLVGAFHQPRAVLIDTATIKTLPRRELSAGWCEAVKNGAVGSRELFATTVTFLSGFRRGSQPPGDELVRFIKAHCAFKAGVVQQDEREDPTRTTGVSRRLLNFGHTVGHALETVTHYKRFRHGEAVGHGIRVAGEISKSMGLLAPSELESLAEAVRLCGPLPTAADLEVGEILDVIRSDKKSIRSSVQWVLLEKIGKPRIIDGSEIPQRLVRDALRRTLQMPLHKNSIGRTKLQNPER